MSTRMCRFLPSIFLPASRRDIRPIRRSRDLLKSEHPTKLPHAGYLWIFLDLLGHTSRTPHLHNALLIGF